MCNKYFPDCIIKFSVKCGPKIQILSVMSELGPDSAFPGTI